MEPWERLQLVAGPPLSSSRPSRPRAPAPCIHPQVEELEKEQRARRKAAAAALQREPRVVRAAVLLCDASSRRWPILWANAGAAALSGGWVGGWVGGQAGRGGESRDMRPALPWTPSHDVSVRSPTADFGPARRPRLPCPGLPPTRPAGLPQKVLRNSGFFEARHFFTICFTFTFKGQGKDGEGEAGPNMGGPGCFDTCISLPPTHFPLPPYNLPSFSFRCISPTTLNAAGAQLQATSPSPSNPPISPHPPPSRCLCPTTAPRRRPSFRPLWTSSRPSRHAFRCRAPGATQRCSSGAGCAALRCAAPCRAALRCAVLRQCCAVLWWLRWTLLQRVMRTCGAALCVLQAPR